jgi:hypothetical protein
MSTEIHIFLHDSELPTRDQWQIALDRLGFPTVLDTGLNIQSARGLSPFRWGGDLKECAAALVEITAGIWYDPQDDVLQAATEAVASVRNDIRYIDGELRS